MCPKVDKIYRKRKKKNNFAAGGIRSDQFSIFIAIHVGNKTVFINLPPVEEILHFKYLGTTLISNGEQ